MRESGNRSACTEGVWDHPNSKRRQIFGCRGRHPGCPRMPSTFRRRRSDWCREWVWGPGCSWDRAEWKSICFQCQDRIPSMLHSCQEAPPACTALLPCPRNDNLLQSASWHPDIFPPRPWMPPRRCSWIFCTSLPLGSLNNIELYVPPGCARAIQSPSRIHFSSHTRENVSQTQPHCKIFQRATRKVRT